ncbi:universal stress protein [Streptomyces sp. NBC_00669]|uniref:universal stress protein n=1 Tax=Streptomyces sp. NBC_00669 TaxID=2976011 RepID=UPI002E31026F|nr:universal stress protein [Streptomyces sp. NBC_00669]
MDKAALKSGLGPVAVGTDGSEHAATAVLWAASEAACRGRPLTVVYAVGNDQTRWFGPGGERLLLEEGDRCLQATVGLVSSRSPELSVETVLSRGDPAESVLEAAGADGTAVVGSRGLGGFSGLLLGSVSLRAAARAQGPLVVVREIAEPETGVVAAAVRDDGDRDALRFAARTALAHGATLRVVSAWMFLEGVGSMVPLVDDVGAIAADEAAATRRTVRPIRQEFPDLEITEETVRTRSVGGALVAVSEQADLLVMGARRPAHAFRTPFGGVTHAVLHHARCPVAVIHRG